MTKESNKITEKGSIKIMIIYLLKFI